MNPAFTVKLEQQIYSGLAVIGKFDGKLPSLACATTGGKILIHSPHESSGSEGSLNKMRFLNLNRKITALAAGSLTTDGTATSNGSNSSSGSTPKGDLIFVGTQSNLLSYDVERNADAFFVEVADGVNSLVVGKLGSSNSSSSSGGAKPLAIAGGNCSILGFDQRGAEAFWTVTGDNVAAMALCDLEGSGRQLLLVGSDDFEIRVFHHEELLTEITEADKVSHLITVPASSSSSNGKSSSNNAKNSNSSSSSGSGSRFAYGLVNGTVGVYGSGGKERQWRVKTKNNVTALHAYDCDLDGVAEIFSGWNNGAFNVRRQDNGEVLFRQTLAAPVAAILSSDYRLSGKEEVLICSEGGEVRGYVASDAELGVLHDSGVAKDNAADQQVLRQLQQQKLELAAELKQIERTLKSRQSYDQPVGQLPPNTQLSYAFDGDISRGAVILRVTVNTDVQIVNLIAEDLEGVMLVDREVVAITPKAQSKVAELPLRPAKFSACELRVQTHVATRSLGAQLHVFETNIRVPKFGGFQYLPDASKQRQPGAKVVFSIRESLDRVMTWLQGSFLVPRIHEPSESSLTVNFISLCSVPGTTSNSNDLLVIGLKNVSEAGSSFLQVRLGCDSIDLAAEIVQDMGQFFRIEELESNCDFPRELQQFEEVVARVAECNAARVTLAADMADDSQRIKALVIRAEDARLMGDMETMRRSYTELSGLNNQLISGYNVRAQNQQQLLTSLKEVNQMIQRASRLRLGKAKARVISECRAAVKASNMSSLFKIIRQGHDVTTAAATATRAAQAK